MIPVKHGNIPIIGSRIIVGCRTMRVCPSTQLGRLGANWVAGSGKGESDRVAACWSPRGWESFKGHEKWAPPRSPHEVPVRDRQVYWKLPSKVGKTSDHWQVEQDQVQARGSYSTKTRTIPLHFSCFLPSIFCFLLLRWAVALFLMMPSA